MRSRNSRQPGEQVLAHERWRPVSSGWRSAEQPAEPHADVGALVGRRAASGRGPRRACAAASSTASSARDAEALPHRLGERPVRDAVAVGQAPPAVPEHRVGEAVDVLLELPPQPRLAGPAAPLTVTRRGVRRSTLAWNSSAQRAVLGVAADHRRLEPVDALGAADAGQHAGRAATARMRLGLALERVLAGVGEADPGRGEPLRGRVDPHRARRGRGLHAGGGVHRVAGDHALADRAEHGSDLAGDDAGPQPQVRRADLGAERGDRGHEVERRPAPRARRHPRTRPACPTRP